MERSGIVTIVSDFGADSFYVGVLKGALVHAAPSCEVVDVTHSIEPHDIAQGSFILDTVYEFFPQGTVFLAVVDPGVGGARANLVVDAGGRYFVGPDNGLATEVVARSGAARAYVIDESKIERFRARPPVGRTFLGRDVFAPAAGALAAGCDPREIGTATDGPPATIDIPPVEVRAGSITARGRYVDSFGNILTGISRGHLQHAFGAAAPGEIRAAVEGQDLGALCDHYEQRPGQSLMAVVNSWDRVEVSVPQGRAIDRFAVDGPQNVSIALSALVTRGD